MVFGKKEHEGLMRICIDARMYNESGIGRYIRNLIFHLQALDKKNEYLILHLSSDYDSLAYHTWNFHKVLADFKWYTLSEQILLPRVLNKIKPDLVHFPHFNVPIFWKGKFVVTIHDLIHQYHSTRRASFHDPLMYKLKQIGYKRVFNFALNKSEKIFTPSKYVKGQLIKEWQVNSQKVVVTSEAVDAKLLTIVSTLVRGKEQTILGKFKINGLYILYVGSAHPHKNVEGLIKAFLEIKCHPDKDSLQLVLSGQDNYFWQIIRKKYNDKNIIYTGFATEEQLAVLYKNATVFVTASLEEGFGLPILEAMAIGCPVVSSNTGSLKEIGGDAAIYFDPLDTFQVSSKITQVLSNEKLRKELIEKGKKQVLLFSWKKLAQQTLEVYQQCA